MTELGWRKWIDAAAGLFLHDRMVPGSTNVLPDAEATFLHLLTLAKAQGATELAFQRHRECVRTRQARIAPDLQLIVRHSLDVHSLVVSANLFWSTLGSLAKQLPAFPELSRVRNENDRQQEETRKVREHIEHLTERTMRGRGVERLGGEMPTDAFRRAVGTIDGDTIRFGNETFELSSIASAVEDAGDKLAAAIADAIPVPSVRVTVSPSVPTQE